MCQTPTDIPKRGSQPGSAVDQRAPLEMRTAEGSKAFVVLSKSEMSTSLWERSTEGSECSMRSANVIQKGVVG